MICCRVRLMLGNQSNAPIQPQHSLMRSRSFTLQNIVCHKWVLAPTPAQDANNHPQHAVIMAMLQDVLHPVPYVAQTCDKSCVGDDIDECLCTPEVKSNYENGCRQGCAKEYHRVCDVCLVQGVSEAQLVDFLEFSSRKQARDACLAKKRITHT